MSEINIVTNMYHGDTKLIAQWNLDIDCSEEEIDAKIALIVKSIRHGIEQIKGE